MLTLYSKIVKGLLSSEDISNVWLGCLLVEDRKAAHNWMYGCYYRERFKLPEFRVGQYERNVIRFRFNKTFGFVATPITRAPEYLQPYYNKYYDIKESSNKDVVNVP